MRPRRRSVAGALVACAAVGAAGCAAEDAQQEAAREEVQAHVRSLGADSGYDPDRARCTDAASTWFRDVETDAFVCAVPRQAGDCDWFAVEVDRERRRVTVRLDRREAGCTLPF